MVATVCAAAVLSQPRDVTQQRAERPDDSPRVSQGPSVTPLGWTHWIVKSTSLASLAMRLEAATDLIEHDPEPDLDLYFRQCSIEVSARVGSMAMSPPPGSGWTWTLAGHRELWLRWPKRPLSWR